MDRKWRKVSFEILMLREKNDSMYSLIEFKYFFQLNVDFICKYRISL